MIFLLTLFSCRNSQAPTNATGLDSDTGTPCTPVDWYQDLDQDGFGGPEHTSACEAPEGYVAQTGDCDDNNAEAFPGAAEVPYDGVDQDCDGSDLRDADGDGDPVETDCDDDDETRASTHFEICNTGVDEDCNGVVDEDCQYFGGVANGAPDKQIFGVWEHGWADLAQTGTQVWVLEDFDEDGLADLGFPSRTYRQDDFHFFSGAQLLSREVLDVDDALFSLNADPVNQGFTYVQGPQTILVDGEAYLSLATRGYHYTVSADSIGSVTKAQADTRVHGDDSKSA